MMLVQDFFWKLIPGKISTFYASTQEKHFLCLMLGHTERITAAKTFHKMPT